MKTVDKVRWIISNYLTLKPTVIAIELTNSCQAKCIMCDHQYLKRKTQNLDFEVFKKTVKEANQAGIKAFQLSFYGEPLLFHRLDQAASYIKNLIPEATIIINTNAFLLNKKTSIKLIKAGISIFSVSIDGNNKDEFEKIRTGLKWDVVRKNIIDLREAINETNSNSKIHIRGLHLKNFPIDIDLYNKTWGNLADNIYIRNDHELDKLEGEKTMNKIVPCHRVFSQVVVLANGEATICAYDWAGSQKLGNINTEGLLQMWFAFNNVLRRLIHLFGFKRILPLCNTCGYKIVR